MGKLIWEVLLFAAVVLIIVKRAAIVALFAKSKYAKGNYIGSLKIFNVADKVGNLGVGDKILFGYNCLRCGYIEKAKKVFADAYMLTKPKSADRYRTMSLQALVDWKSGDIDTAIERLEEVYESGYKNSNVYENLGIMYNLSGDYEKALAFNLEAYDYNSDDNIIVDTLADTYHLMGNLEKSREVYEELIARDPEPRFPEAYYGYGRVLIELGERDRGLEMIEKSLSKPFSFLSLHSKEEIEKLYEDEKNKK